MATYEVLFHNTDAPSTVANVEHVETNGLYVQFFDGHGDLIAAFSRPDAYYRTGHDKCPRCLTPRRRG